MRTLLIILTALFVADVASADPDWKRKYDAKLKEIAEKPKDAYVGEQKDGLPHGQGTYTTSYGAKHVGEWKDGEQHGQGTSTWPDGRKYVGEYKDDYFHGQGTWTAPDGTKYVGEWKDGLRKGQGTLTHPNGDKFEGNFSEFGGFHGHASLTFHDDSTYVGQWISRRGPLYLDGLKHGQGTRTYASGLRYSGEWKENTWEGQGTLSHPDGREYVGGFSDDKYNGQGTLSYPDGKKWTGEWTNGKKNGSGTLALPGGQEYDGEWKDSELIEYSDSRNAYDGDMKDGVYHGSGSFIYPDGSRYEGEWENGKREGQGSLTLNDDSRYEGGWKDGKYHGWGVLKVLNPDIFTQGYFGGFKEGLYDGWGTWTSRDGRKYVGDFSEGAFRGQGTYIWPDGGRVAGQYALNTKGVGDIQGKVFCSDGQGLKGEWTYEIFLEATPDSLCISPVAENPKLETPSKSLASQKLSNSLGIYKEECGSLGFKEGTEKFGQCVLTLRESRPIAVETAKKPKKSNKKPNTTKAAKRSEPKRTPPAPRGDGSKGDRTCQSFGFTVGSGGYGQCRLELELAARQVQQKQAEYARQQAAYEEGQRLYNERVAAARKRKQNDAVGYFLLGAARCLVNGTSCAGVDGTAAGSRVVPNKIEKPVQPSDTFTIRGPSGQRVRCRHTGVEYWCN